MLVVMVSRWFVLLASNTDAMLRCVGWLADVPRGKMTDRCSRNDVESSKEYYIKL